nr:zinc finger, CCHC-type [Tanacetum cinerariifolium]
FFGRQAAAGYRQVKVLEFFDCPGPRQGVEDLRDVELQGAQRDRKAEVFHVSNDDTAVAQRRLEDKQPEEKTNTDCLSGMSKVFWAKDTTRSIYLVNMLPSSAIRFKKPIDMLEFFGWLASIKQGILEPVKFKCIFLGYHKSIVANKLWRLDDVTSKVVLYRTIGFNESGEYKKTFISSGVGTDSMQVLHGFEFEVKPLWDHTFEVEPQKNVDQGAGLQEAEIWAIKGLLVKAKGNILNLEIIRDQSGNTQRVSQSRIHNEKLVQTLLKGHSTLSLEDSLSMDCDVKK